MVHTLFGIFQIHARRDWIEISGGTCTFYTHWPKIPTTKICLFEVNEIFQFGPSVYRVGLLCIFLLFFSSEGAFRERISSNLIIIYYTLFIRIINCWNGKDWITSSSCTVCILGAYSVEKGNFRYKYELLQLIV